MIEAPVTGTSLNPARTLGPAILAPNYTALWVYFAGRWPARCIAAAAFQRPVGRPDRLREALSHGKVSVPVRYAASTGSCQPGETVMSEGEAGAEAYVVERGRARSAPRRGGPAR